MKRFFYIFLFLPFCLSAQTNETDSLKLKASLSLTGIFQGGNVKTIIFRAKSNISYKAGEKWVFNTQNSYVYQEFGREKADEDILSLNFLYFNPTRKVYPLLLGFVSTNFRRQIDIRSLFGVGITFQVLKKDDNWIKFSLSSEYEQTEFLNNRFNRTVYNGNQFINTFRGTIWVSAKYHLFDKKLIASYESFYQPSLEQGDNYRWQVELGLEIPLKKFLNFKIDYRSTYESIVIEDQEEGDRFLTFGFTLKNF